MTDKELERAKAFLDAMGVDYSGDIIYLTDGGNSCVVNMETEWQEFISFSINSVAEGVAEMLGKPTKRISDKRL